MRIIIALLLGVLALSSCGTDQAPTAASTAGSYTSNDGKFEADVTKDQIEIFLVSEDSKSLYWSGTWSSGDTVTSQANVKKLESSLLGSQNKSKEFAVGSDAISFKFSILGTTRDVTLER
jgi:hypothetical protein